MISTHRQLTMAKHVQTARGTYSAAVLMAAMGWPLQMALWHLVGITVMERR